MEIKTEHAVCEDCDNYIFDLDFAVKGADGTILCKSCLKKWLDGDFVAALEWVQTAEITNGEHLRRKYIDEERVALPRGRDIA